MIHYFFLFGIYLRFQFQNLNVKMGEPMETASTPGNTALKVVSNTPVVSSSPLRSKDVLLPLARVRTIMKSSPDVENIGQESLFLITKV